MKSHNIGLEKSIQVVAEVLETVIEKKAASLQLRENSQRKGPLWRRVREKKAMFGSS